MLNSSKTWPHRANLTTVLISAPQKYPENALKAQFPWNSFKIVDLCYLQKKDRIVYQNIWKNNHVPGFNMAAFVFQKLKKYPIYSRSDLSEFVEVYQYENSSF